MKRLVFEPEHEQFGGTTARQFLEKECAPHAEKWESGADRRPRILRRGRQIRADRVQPAGEVRRRRCGRLPVQRGDRRGGSRSTAPRRRG